MGILVDVVLMSVFFTGGWLAHCVIVQVQIDDFRNEFYRAKDDRDRCTTVNHFLKRYLP